MPQAALHLAADLYLAATDRRDVNRQVFADAAAIQHPTWLDYERLKRRLSRIVGWGALDPRHASSDAYDAAIRRLAQELGL